MEKGYGFFSREGDEQMELPPGFRFHPTDEELITHYLSPKVLDTSFSPVAIGDVDLNKVEPWDLPWRAKLGEKEWYFFCVRDRKYPTGLRTNRATDAGYWKATGKDKEIYKVKTLVGMKKTLVFYKGRAPRGEKTNWVMHEYRLDGKCSMRGLPEAAKNEWVICRIFKKSSGGKKVHISGLTRSSSSSSYGGDSRSSDLPPLVDISSSDYDGQTRRTAVVSDAISHLSYLSEPAAAVDDQKPLEYRTPSSSNSKTSDFPSPAASSQNRAYIESMVYPDSVMLQDESILRLLLQNNGPLQAAKPEFFSLETGGAVIGSDHISPVLSNQEVGCHDQYFPVGPVDLACLWDY